MRKSGSHVSARRGKGAICAVVAVLVAFVAALGITTTAQAALSDHTVPGVSPRGTTINVFDYWIQSRDYNDQNNGENYQSRGINANHVLKFGVGMGTEADETVINANAVNYWTNSSAPRQGIVSNSLGADGYPVLSGTGNIGTSSLGYLFDSTSFNGKDAYMDVDGLLQVDDEGYYYYNSQANFAQFNDDGNGSGDFTLFNTWGVEAAGSSPDGQFFPFNSAAGDGQGDGAILTERGSGITRTDITSTDAAINHYFGLNMSTRFVQQDGGYTAPQSQGGKPVTYEFSGDDDVWIYIDGVLVGDLGGIHDASSISINFATGSVVINEGKTKQVAANRWEQDAYPDDGGNWVRDVSIEQRTTLGAIMSAAGVTTGLAGDTFADDTYHTLDFFYLERGNTDSNMSLKYNLVNIPESGVVKVDQYGDALQGVQFTLREADADYSPVNGGMTVSGTTNNNGEFIFIHEVNGQDMPITLEQLEAKGPYWVLTEDNVPKGYRSGGEMHLRFEDGFLLSSNEWDTGAWAEPHVTAVAPTQVVGTDGQTYDPADGIVFAVVFQYDDNGALHPVSGDDEKGWSVAEGTGKSDIIAAAKANNYQFLLGSGGGYETTIENLPGDILTYEYVVNSNPGSAAVAKYAVRYYYVRDVDSVHSLDSSSNIIDLNPNASGNDFDRIFSVTLNVPNIKNELTLVKTDATSSTKLEIAEFALYEAASFGGVEDPGDEIGTFTTDVNGSFNVTTSGDLLVKGEYVLVETAAPSGYELEQTPISIVVDDEGVHVDAGTAEDNVSVETGIGDLVYSMKSFAAGDDVDSTLHDVKAQAQTTGSYDGASTKWVNASAAVTHYQYDDKPDGLSYVRNLNVLDNGDATFIAEAGWSRLDLSQCMTHQGEDPIKNKEDLGNQSLNALFTGDVTIHVTNAKTPTDLTIPAASALQITKNLTASGDYAADLVNADAGAYQFTIKAVDTKGDGQPTAADAAAKLGLADGETTMPVNSPVLTQGTGDAANVWSGTTNPLTSGLTFTTADRGQTFTYEISEVVPEDVPAGYVYDGETHRVTYAVSGGTTTNLSVKASVDGVEATGGAPNVTFNNVVSATIIGGDDASAVFIIKKTVNVETDQNFSFIDKLESATAADGTPIEDGVWGVVVDGEGNTRLQSFTQEYSTFNMRFDEGNNLTQSMPTGKRVFTKPGTYVFSVCEDIPADKNGWTYDTNVKTVTVKVDEDMNVSYDPTDRTAAFTNTYNATGELPLDGTGAIDLSKALTGRDWIEADSFTFTLTGKNVTDGADESAGFSLSETTVTVGYEDAVAAAEQTGSEATEGVAVPFGFDSITFTQTGTYEFTVTEGAIDSQASPNVSNASGTSVTYRVEVTDDVQDGKLEVGTPTVVGQAGTGVFVNNYDPSADIAGMQATKTLNGSSDGIEAGAFTFEVKNIEKPNGVATTPMPSYADASGRVTNDADGTISFGTLKFDTEGTYAYQISEVNGGKTGYTYSDVVYTVVYDVSDDPETGALFANATYYVGKPAQGNAIDAADVVFANTYDPVDVTVDPDPNDAYAGFRGAKTVTVEHGTFAGIQEGQFAFWVSALRTPDGVTAPYPSNTQNVGGHWTATNDANGLIDFGSLTFTEPGEYCYTVREADTNSVAGVTNDSTTYTLTFNIEDVDGQLTVTSKSITDQYENTYDGTDLDFENIYNDGETSYAIGGIKVLDTNGYKGASLEQGDFTFVLVDEDGNEIDRVTNGAVNGNTATFQFDSITYDEAGTYAYKVYELGVDGNPGTGGTDGARVTHSTEVYTVTVSVTEANDGRGLAASADVDSADIVFTNAYEPTPVVVGPNGSAQIGGTKVLDLVEGSSRSMEAGEFEFLLLEGGTEVDRATNAEDGSFVFDDIAYDTVGTHHYTVSEVDKGQGGITYDGALYSVTVDVTENTQTHALEAKVTYVNNADASTSVSQMVFTNTYEAAPVTATLGVSKELKGGTLAEGQFTFELTGSAGAPMPAETTAANAADGAVSFGSVTFDAVGEYDYTVTEVNDAQDGVTYDADATRTIHVSVTDDGMGHLVAEVTYGADGSHFVNTYVPTEDPVDPGTPGGDDGSGGGTGDGGELVPDAGDHSGQGIGLVAVLGAVAAACGVVVRRATKRQ